MGETVTGGCQCRHVRYTVELDSDEASLCHCGMCRRATGGVAAPWFIVKKAALCWTAAEPASYVSSPIARRGFCPRCGSPLTFDYPESDEIDVTVGSLDRPEAVRPTHHFAWEHRLPAWLDTSALPHYRLDENPATVDRWRNAVGKLPD